MAARKSHRSLILTAVTAWLVAACGVSIASPSGASGTTGAQAPKWVTLTPPAKGSFGTVTWDLPYGEPTSLDPTQAAAYSDNAVLANLCESLVRLTPGLAYEPGLAASYSHPTPTTWVYDIRQGVRFWNGKLLTADDVVYSLERNVNPASFWNDPFYTDVKSVTKTGPNQVTVTLSQPDATFNEMMATAAGAIGEASYIKAKGKAYGTAEGGVMCTGPYELKSWTPGESLTITRNPTYWDTSLKPKTKSVKFLFIQDPSTITDGLESGQIDGAYEVPVTAVQTLEKSGVGQFYLGRSTEFGVLAFTTKAGPIQNPVIRQALSLAIDRKAIASTVFGGAAVPIYSLSFPSTYGYAKSTFQQGYNALVKAGAYDLARAKKLVKGAGSPTKVLSMLVNADDPASTETALYVQSAAKKIGLTIKIVQVPASQVLSIQFSAKARDAYDIMLQYTGYYDVPEPLEQGLFGMQAGALFNYNNYSNALVNKDLGLARGAADPTTRARLINQLMAQGIGKDESAVPLVNYAERLFMNNSITGAPAGLPAYLYYPWAALLGSSK